MLNARRVAVARSTATDYSVRPPFHPPRIYPELEGHSWAAVTDPTNQVYDTVRESLHLAGLDAPRFGTPAWNPFRDLVGPGQRVLIKPNWVAQGHHLNDTWEQIVTHGSVIRPVLDYVRLALGEEGQISLADGPMQSSDIAEIMRRTGIQEIQRYFAQSGPGPELRVLDLRTTFLETRDDVVIRRHRLPGDPDGEVVVDLGRSSLFHGFRGEGRYYGADYDTTEVNRHHHGDVQEYKLSGTAVGADLIIDVPKLKTHQKVGVTLSLKGVVGLNCGRNWLPHRTQGTPEQGGDQFAESGWRQRLEHSLVRRLEQASLRYPNTIPHLYRRVKRIGRVLLGATHQTVRGGGWHGNDTLWRMALDINRALVYADASGHLHRQPAKRRFCVVDGIVAGEGVGPIYADPKPCGLVIAGGNPVAVDVVSAELMGFDYRQLPMLNQAFALADFPLIEYPADAIEVVSGVAAWSGGLDAIRTAVPFAFAAPKGWEGHMERLLSPAEGSAAREAGGQTLQTAKADLGLIRRCSAFPAVKLP